MQNQTKQNTLGIIACLTTGFEELNRRLWLIAIPVVLDLFLWLGPRLSVAPLVERMLAFLVFPGGADPAVAQNIDMLKTAVREMAQQFNLFSLLGTFPLLNVPSLMARKAPLTMPGAAAPHVIPVDGAGPLLLWWGGLALLGLGLGVVYLMGVAQLIQDRKLEDALRPAPLSSPWRVWGWLVLLAVAGGMVGMAGLMGVSLFATLMGGNMLMLSLLSFATTTLVLFVLFHLLFTVHGLIYTRHGPLQAAVESTIMVRLNFLPTTLLVLLILVIYEGLNLAWALAPDNSWLGLVGILGNAYIGTGLTAATFVFFRQRYGLLVQLRERVAKEVK